MITMTGKTLDQVKEILTAPLEDGAYKSVPGATGLTNIDPAYLREKLTEAFGLCGSGWWFGFGDDGLEVLYVEKTYKRNTPKEYKITEARAIIRKFELFYTYRWEEGGEPLISTGVLSAGSSDDSDPGNAIKGAITNALGKAASMLLWQLDVYKGKKDGKRPANGKESKQGRTGELPEPITPTISAPALLATRNDALMAPADYGATEYWEVAKALGVDREAGQAILKENGGSFADSLIKVIDQYGGPEYEKLREESKK